MENECVPYLSGWHGFHIVGKHSVLPRNALLWV